jgi:DNA ligase D-like protein (predicted 3'-phosphoesterase)
MDDGTEGSSKRISSQAKLLPIARAIGPSKEEARQGATLRYSKAFSTTQRHYDFRLEVDGVLKSWAVPKGPSTDQRAKRFATEDHPLEYAEFKGVIPEGEHGGGTMRVWDRGTYRNLTKKNAEEVPIKQVLEKGHANIWLNAQKVKGGYSLTRIAKGKKER